MMNESGIIPITVELYTEMVATCENAKALERYVKREKYDVSREKIAAILGFGLEVSKEDANM